MRAPCHIVDITLLCSSNEYSLCHGLLEACDFTGRSQDPNPCLSGLEYSGVLKCIKRPVLQPWPRTTGSVHLNTPPTNRTK